jgi:hypothetical protein
MHSFHMQFVCVCVCACTRACVCVCGVETYSFLIKVNLERFLKSWFGMTGILYLTVQSFSVGFLHGLIGIKTCEN